jgi:hypothetical protein
MVGLYLGTLKLLPELLGVSLNVGPVLLTRSGITWPGQP